MIEGREGAEGRAAFDRAYAHMGRADDGALSPS